MKLNSVVFHTPNIDLIRDFYEGKLGFPTGTFVKDGKTVPDSSINYVNYHIEGAMLCFEAEGERTDRGTVIIHVADYSAWRARVEAAGIEISGGNSRYFKIKDPDGRSLIFEPFVV